MNIPLPSGVAGFIWLDFADTSEDINLKSRWQEWPGRIDNWYMSQIGKKYIGWSISTRKSAKRLADFRTGIGEWFHQTHRIGDIVDQVLIGEFGYSYSDFNTVVIGGGGIGGQAWWEDTPGGGFAVIGETTCIIQPSNGEITPLWHEMAHIITMSGKVGHSTCFGTVGGSMCSEIKDAILVNQASILTEGGDKGKNIWPIALVAGAGALFIASRISRK